MAMPKATKPPGWSATKKGKKKSKSSPESDPRFSHVHSDPRFQRAPKKGRKFKVDDRFSKMFTDERFNMNYVVDETGWSLNS